MNDTSMHPPEPTVASWGAPAPAAPVVGAIAAPVNHAGYGGVARHHESGTPRTRRFGGRWLMFLVIGALVFVVPTVMSSLSNGSGVSLGSGDGNGISSSIGSSIGMNNDYSSYYGEVLNGDNYSSRWQRDSTLHTESGAYDGPYDYSGYGVDGMKARAKSANVDPLYTDGGSLPDVFDQYGVDAADPLNGAPATARGTARGPDPVNPYYDPWATQYQNPYQNRLDLSFGSASSRSAWLDGTDLGVSGY